MNSQNFFNNNNQNYYNSFNNSNKINYPSFNDDDAYNNKNNNKNINETNINSYNMNRNYNNQNMNNDNNKVNSYYNRNYNDYNIKKDFNYNINDNLKENYYNINSDNNYKYDNKNNNQKNNKFDDDFEIIEDEEGDDGNDSENVDIIKTMAVLKSENEQNWKDSFKSFVSSLYYNGYNYSFSKKFDKNSTVLPVYIYNKKIDKIIRDEIKFPLKSFLYMSYRSGLINLKNLGLEECSSDCGWGCMLRCCQMLLSKGLIEKKKFDFFFKQNRLIDYKIIENFRREILCLFSDNYLGLELVREHPDYKFFWKKYETLAKSKPIYNSISEIIPPYSIHILCKLGKFVGTFTSNIKMINLFCKINSQIFNELNFIHFECGCISKKQLLKEFCEECMDFDNNKDIISYNGVDYRFKKPGIIFISLRLGLYELEPMYHDFIPLIFSKFRNNFGFVGGKKDRAYYFIGIQGDNKLILVDPHLNQQMNNDFEKDYDSYNTQDLYLLDINELSSSFSFAIGIFNSTHFSQFIEDFNWFAKDNKYNQILYFGKD